MVALVLADAVLEKFGGDSLGETARNVAAYLADAMPHVFIVADHRDVPKRWSDQF